MIAISLSMLLGILALSVSVAAALGLLALLLASVFSPINLYPMLGEVAWQAMSSETLVAIPFFIMLGEILLRAGIAERMYRMYNALVEWISWLPGGTMHANIGSSALFAASSGSSVATAATIGTVAMPEIKRRGYAPPLFLGTIAAGGTLGILIPPSVILVIYGILTETSIPRLYLAGFIPGILLALMFMAFVMIVCIAKPKLGGTPVKTSWSRRIEVLPDLLPPLFIFAVVVLTIYAGIATPTEAAAFGVVAALFLAAVLRRLSWPILREAIQGTMRTTAMVVAIVLSAFVLNFVIGFLGISQDIANAVISLDLSPTQLMLAIVVFYLILGCFLEGFSIILITVPVVVPVVVQLGYDPIWFGIVVTLLLEAALITPPIGVNLYVVQGVRGTGSIMDVIVGSAPFVILMFLMILALMAFPQLALWLPSVVF
ncbi:MAG: TRAP transporter large permease [Devosiaceae bacterium]|nr:TRAP transporter large permease [Devosiaceae bacterium MH13]